MTELFDTGRVTDLIIGLMCAELVLILALRVKTGRGPTLTGVVANILAGICLMLALRAALTGAGWQTTAAWLAAALPAHVFDLIHRWHERSTGSVGKERPV